MLIANRKPKEKIKYRSNGNKNLNSGVNLLRAGLFQSTCDIFLLSTIFFVRCANHDAEIGILNFSA